MPACRVAPSRTAGAAVASPEEQRAVLQPQRQEVGVGPQRAASPPEQQAVAGRALEAHEEVGPGAGYPEEPGDGSPCCFSKRKEMKAAHAAVHGLFFFFHTPPFEDVPVVVGQVASADELRNLDGFSHGWEEAKQGFTLCRQQVAALASNPDRQQNNDSF